MKTSLKAKNLLGRFFLGYLFLFSVTIFANNLPVVYYDSDFYKTKAKDKAAYYAFKNPGDTSNDQKYKCFYITGELYWQGLKSHFSNNLNYDTKEGLSTFYYKNGVKKIETTYSNNQEDGFERRYNEDGKMVSEENYSDGELKGLSVTFYANGKKEKEENYDNGVLNGAYTKYYENGNIKLKRNFLKGELSGHETSYYENGNLKEKKIYFKIMHTDTGWYESGAISWINPYKEGKRDGESFSWYDDHKVKSKSYYKNGELQGKQYEFYKDQSIKSLEEYNHNHRTGMSLSYWENKKIKRQENYVDDSLIQGKCFDSTGTEIAYYDRFEMPEFPGGETSLNRFLAIHINYPARAVDREIQGRVILEFLVDSTGKVGDITVVKSVYFLLDREAIRVLKSMPKWEPGKDEGVAVNVSYRVPVKFTLH